jgi:hypothetical protein
MMSPETRAKLLVGDDDEARIIAAEFLRQRELGEHEDGALAEALALARREGCFGSSELR